MAAVTFLGSAVSIASPAAIAVTALKPAASVKTSQKALIIRASAEQKEQSRRSILKFAGAVIAATAFTGNANAGLVDDLLRKSEENKALNDAKRLATSGANSSRPWTVVLNTCKFPENFTGCEDLAKKGNVAFISDDLELECKGKEPGKCNSNNLWNSKSTSEARS